ncbi:MAG: P-loop ATPase, Sll1717 family [Acutalibacter sp.]
MNEIKIKDIYAGKPDAKDEIDFGGLEEFIKTYVVAEHFNVESLISGTNCFITGFKGTGKTALLFYLDSRFKEIDESTCSSFIFFKEEFTDTKRSELESIARRILSSISVEKNALVDNQEFEYIWRWLLFKRIVSDNEEYNRGLFIDDENWEKFESVIGKIKSPNNKRKFIIPKKIKMAVPYVEPSTQSVITPEVEVDLQNTSDDNYLKFMEVIDEAERLLMNATRTDIPYYIFVDELEAYYGNISVFKRDLCLIRDLIFTVKRFNSNFSTINMKCTKIICSVRSEIITAISRFIVTKELNKVTAGFAVPLMWNYSNTSSYMHPIIQILLKRIAVCEGCVNPDYKKVYERWLPENIHGIEPANYILNNNWCKPRDIVRLITTMQNSIYNSSKAFTQSVFDSIVKTYSEDSLIEIKEELRALYDTDQIDTIINCFMGYKTTFSVSQLKQRIKTYFQGSILEAHFTQVIDDLYRLGFLGNFLPVSKTYRWQHKGDSRVILSEEWRLVVHYALHGALSLGGQQNYGLNRGELPEAGDVAQAIVKKIIKSFAIVEFRHYGKVYCGSIHISEFTKFGYGYIPNLKSITQVGDEYKVVLKEYNKQRESWKVEIVENET